MHMKRITSLFALTLTLLMFAACKNQNTDSPQMYIEKAALSEQESNIASLFNIDDTNKIYDFVVDDTIKSLEITGYKLTDGKWDVYFKDKLALSEPKGRIGFFYDKLYKETRISFQNSQGTSSSSRKSSENFEDLESLGYSGMTLSDRHSIVCQEEIPVALQIFSSKNSISCILRSSIEELMDYYENTEPDHEAVFAVTVKFSSEKLS